jgi:non-heme chloroperoxidase
LQLVGDGYGDPHAPPVLLLHGGGQTRHAWASTARALGAGGFYAVALDQRGHGESEWATEGRYDLDAFAEDLRVVAHALSRRPIVVGASLGGLAALLAEGEAQAPVLSALVLVDVAPRLELPGVARIVQFMTAHPDGFPSLEAAEAAVAAYLPHRPRPRDTRGLEKNLRRGADGRYRWHWDPRFVRQEHGLTPEQFMDRMLHSASRLSLPTLLVRGRLSDVLSEEGSREFLDLVSHAEFVDVASAAHMVAGDRNDRFTEAVLDFLGRRCHGS